MRKNSRRTRLAPVARRFEFDLLDGRALPSVMLQHGILNVGGTSAADVINVDTDSQGNLQVDLNGHSYNFESSLVHGLRIVTRGGDDTVSISDTVSVGASVSGGSGNDSIDGGSGNDSMNGGAGNDQINGGAGDDTEIGLSGDDTLDGGTGDDSLDGGVGDDVETGDDGNDQVVGGVGNDNLDGGAGDDEMQGGVGDDSLDGGAGDDFVDGGIGNDDCLGGDGDDVIDGGSGDDQIDGEAGSNLVDGDTGSDVEDNGQSVSIELQFGARLDGPTDAAGQAWFFTQQDAAGNVQSMFALHVEDAAAGTYDVSVDGTTIGQLSVDSSGEGELALASNPTESGQVALPADFPSIHAGSEVRIASGDSLLLDGWFHNLDSSHGHHPGPQPAQDAVASSGFVAHLSGSTEAAGAAWFGQRTADNGDSQRAFAVGVEHAAAGSYNVLVDGTVVGQLTVNDFGYGRLGFATVPQEDGQVAFPAGFPDIHADSIVQLISGDNVLVSGSFAAWTPVNSGS